MDLDTTDTHLWKPFFHAVLPKLGLQSFQSIEVTAIDWCTATRDHANWLEDACTVLPPDCPWPHFGVPQTELVQNQENLEIIDAALASTYASDLTTDVWAHHCERPVRQSQNIKFPDDIFLCGS